MPQQDTLVIHPWNPKNTYVKESDIHAIFEAMGIASKISIKSLDLY